jgi:hypothetical protein
MGNGRIFRKIGDAAATIRIVNGSGDGIGGLPGQSHHDVSADLLGRNPAFKRCSMARAKSPLDILSSRSPAFVIIRGFQAQSNRLNPVLWRSPAMGFVISLT